MTEDTLLLRQVNPVWVQEGKVTSQVFKPTPKDRHQLSCYDGDQITAERAWLHFTNELRLRSAGVLAVSVAECQAQDLPVIPDPEQFPEHVVIEFAGLGGSEVSKRAKLLKAAAERRGWQYLAD